MTLRRRSAGLLRQMATLARSAWRQAELEVAHRQYQHPKVIDQQVELPGYKGKIRQLFITELGHEEPTILLGDSQIPNSASAVTVFTKANPPPRLR